MDLEALRLIVYRVFAATGHAPTFQQMQDEFIDGDWIRAGLRELAQRKLLVLGAEDQILMAHPFSSVPLGFSVMGEERLWWGGCAWDSFALPHLLEVEHPMLVSTRCPNCSSPHSWNVGRLLPPTGDQIAHFLTPVSRQWEDIIHACGSQRIFCSEDCVASWLATNKLPRGYVLSLETLWRLASHWYDGRLDYGYQRKGAAEAAQYFRSVGLDGPFWGL